MRTARRLILLVALPIAAGCPEPATDKIGDLDTSLSSCDRIHGLTGIIMMQDGGNQSHFPTAAPSETLSTSSVAGPRADGSWVTIENGRVFLSANGGCDWEASGGSIPNTGNWKLLTSGSDIYAFDRDSGAVAYSADGLNWSSGDASEPFIGSPVADPAVAGRLRGVQARGVATSEDFGITWTPQGSPPPAVPNGAAMYPGDLETAAISHDGGIAITRNGGTSWEEIGAELLDRKFVTQSVAFATTDAGTVWAAGEDDEHALIYRTVDGGGSWNDVATSKSIDLEATAPLWPVPGVPNEVVSAWGTSVDAYGIHVYDIVAGSNIHTTKVGSYYHVNDVAFAEDGSWLLAVDGIP